MTGDRDASPCVKSLVSKSALITINDTPGIPLPVSASIIVPCTCTPCAAPNSEGGNWPNPTLAVAVPISTPATNSSILYDPAGTVPGVANLSQYAFPVSPSDQGCEDSKSRLLSTDQREVHEIPGPRSCQSNVA